MVNCLTRYGKPVVDNIGICQGHFFKKNYLSLLLSVRVATEGNLGGQSILSPCQYKRKLLKEALNMKGCSSENFAKIVDLALMQKPILKFLAYFKKIQVDEN
jgi:hypothetical protein